MKNTMNPPSAEDKRVSGNGRQSDRYTYSVSDPKCETDKVALKKFLPKLFLGHTIQHWVLWILGAVVVAVWFGPALMELINRFVVQLWHVR